MGGGLRTPASHTPLENTPQNQVVWPVPHTNALTQAVSTNVRVKVFMQITNETTDVWFPPYCLQGLAPGSTSCDTNTGAVYTGSPNWTSVTFKVTGALQNDYARDRWVPLRWFVFGPLSFDADDCTAVIEVDDPFTTASPAYSQGWFRYPGTPVFYSWTIDEERQPQSTEMLKKDSTY